MEIPVYNLQGQVTGKQELNQKIFGMKVKPQVVYQAVVAQQANSRRVLAHTKDRSEVRGGGKKPWKQKGTGRARHGSIRSPLWRGGGITFGPIKERNFSLKINKKVRRLALQMSLADKAHNNKIYLVEHLNFEHKKTKDALGLFSNLSIRPKKTEKEKGQKSADGKNNAMRKSILVVLAEKEKDSTKIFNNLPKVHTISSRSMNTVDVVKHEYILFSKEGLVQVEEVYGT